ncbi:MAG: hypothetical protein NZM11_07315 [Anaerolineales bacterium]|nr:hypothetical protein [Anaerolineales bacterium]
MTAHTAPASLDRWVFATAGLSALSGLLYVAAPEQLGGLIALCAQSVAGLLTLPDGFEQQFVVFGFFFLASAWQWLLAIMLMAYRQRLSRELLWTALVWTAAIVATWVILKLVALFGGGARPVGLMDLVVQLLQAATFGGLLVLLLESRTSRKRSA